jgi:mono/diheme cytochrome c family protein
MLRAVRFATLTAIAGLGLATTAVAQGGESGFQDNCAACHGPEGKGVPGAFPALAGDPFVTGDPDAVVSVVLKGRAGMPSFKDDLKDPDIADILTYVRGAWGNKAGAVTPPQVAAQRAKLSASAQHGLQAH